MTYREALNHVIRAAVFYFADDARKLPELRRALNIVISEAERDAMAEATRAMDLMAAWMSPDPGARQ
jgi:hypothetical protein